MIWIVIGLLLLPSVLIAIAALRRWRQPERGAVRVEDLRERDWRFPPLWKPEIERHAGPPRDDRLP